MSQIVSDQVQPEREEPRHDQPAILVGIDWSDSQHEFVLAGPDGKQYRGAFDQDPTAITSFLTFWKKRMGIDQMAIALETNNGPLVNALLEHDNVAIYPVNPAALASYREAFAHGGGKNDQVDAALILQYLTHYQSHLMALHQDQMETRWLRALVRDRRQVVEQRVDLSLQLKSLLKTYFPAVLHMKAAKPYAEFLLQLIAKYPTLAAINNAGKGRVRKLFYGMGSTARIEERIEVLFKAQPLTTDEVVLNTASRKAQLLATQLLLLNQAIRDYDQEIRQALGQHPLSSVVESLPCGVTSKARIIAALGDDKRRYKSATDFTAAVGIAPITTQSGKSRYVSSRWATSKFLRQTFHEFAGVTIKRCPWSKAFYESQIAKGKTSRMAKRALAYKWIRIIYRCWQTDTPYDEQKYLQQLIKTQSPLAKKLAA